MPATPPLKSPARQRPSGGTNQMLGAFDEHLDENDTQAAAAQQALTQQAASTATLQTPPPTNQAAPTSGQPPAEPREVGSLKDELINRPLEDIGAGLKSLFDLKALGQMLGLPQKDEGTPEEQAKKKQLLQRYNQLTEEQQAVARQKYQEEMQKKKAEEQEKQMKKQQAEQQKAQTINMPSSPKKGPVGPGGSGKQRAVNKLEQDRKTLSGPASAN